MIKTRMFIKIKANSLIYKNASIHSKPVDFVNDSKYLEAEGNFFGEKIKNRSMMFKLKGGGWVHGKDVIHVTTDNVNLVTFID